MSASRCAALRAMDLADCAERRTDTLSGGEQRRVAIAGLLAQEPDVYLVDEPTNHLDPHHQLAVLALLRDLASTRRQRSSPPCTTRRLRRASPIARCCCSAMVAGASALPPKS